MENVLSDKQYNSDLEVVVRVLMVRLAKQRSIGPVLRVGS